MALFLTLPSSSTMSLRANPLHLNVDLSEDLANVRPRRKADAGDPIIVVGGEPESQSDPGVGSHFHQVSSQPGGEVGWNSASHVLEC